MTLKHKLELFVFERMVRLTCKLSQDKQAYYNKRLERIREMINDRREESKKRDRKE